VKGQRTAGQLLNVTSVCTFVEICTVVSVHLFPSAMDPLPFPPPPHSRVVFVCLFVQIDFQGFAVGEGKNAERI
jgi:hypothetical protein